MDLFDENCNVLIFIYKNFDYRWLKGTNVFTNVASMHFKAVICYGVSYSIQRVINKWL